MALVLVLITGEEGVCFGWVYSCAEILSLVIELQSY